MRPSEARLVLTKLFGAYRTQADEATVLVYAEALAPIDLDIALSAVAAVIATEDRLPSMSRLMAAVRVERRRTLRATRVLAAPRPRNWQQVNVAGVRSARAVLARTEPQPSVELVDQL